MTTTAALDDLTVIREIHAAFSRTDLDSIFTHPTEDVAITQSDVLPWGGNDQGHDGTPGEHR